MRRPRLPARCPCRISSYLHQSPLPCGSGVALLKRDRHKPGIYTTPRYHFRYIVAHMSCLDHRQRTARPKQDLFEFHSPPRNTSGQTSEPCPASYAPAIRCGAPGSSLDSHRAKPGSSPALVAYSQQLTHNRQARSSSLRYRSANCQRQTLAPRNHVSPPIVLRFPTVVVGGPALDQDPHVLRRPRRRSALTRANQIAGSDPQGLRTPVSGESAKPFRKVRPLAEAIPSHRYGDEKPGSGSAQGAHMRRPSHVKWLGRHMPPPQFGQGTPGRGARRVRARPWNRANARWNHEIRTVTNW